MFAPKIAKARTKAAESPGSARPAQRSPLAGRPERHEGAAWDFAGTPLHPQQADDPLEHEADRGADQVMRMNGPAPSLAADPPHGETLQTMPADAREAGGHMASEVGALHGSGLPLPAPRRTFFESRLGHDFTGIRIHADSRAAKLAASVNARAFTLGRDIVFGAGEYAPDSADGTRLLAHELVHTVQQQGSPAIIQRQPATKKDPFASGGVYDQLEILREGSLPLDEYDPPPPPKPDFKTRMANLQTKRFQRKLQAITKLGELRDERAVKALIDVVDGKLFFDPNEFEPQQKLILQQEAVASLGKIGGPVALAKLNDLLTSKDPKDRTTGARGFSAAGGGQVATSLLTALKKETDPGVKAQIITALGNIADSLSNQEKEPIGKELIREEQSSTGDVLPRAAIDALGKLKLKSTTEPLLDELKQHLGIVNLVEDITRALGEIGDARAVDVLVILLEKHGTAGVRSEAATALGKIGGTKALAALNRRLGQEPDNGVKAAISKALKSSASPSPSPSPSP